MMGSTFEISVDGKRVFTWKGDQEAVEHILEAFPEMQMMAILWRVLEAETGNPDHPGRIASYVGAADFTVDLHETKIEGDLIEVKFNIIVSPQEAGLA